MRRYVRASVWLYDGRKVLKSEKYCCDCEILRNFAAANCIVQGA